VVVVAAAIVLIPGAPLVPILVGTQALNAVLLQPLLVFIRGLASNRKLMVRTASAASGGRRARWRSPARLRA
jgi:Mn2+/Fe2+ NRAMP family transporter